MKQTTAFAAALLALGFGACSDSQFDGFTRAENGLHYRFFTHDENGKKIEAGDGILIRYVIMNHRNDSVIVDSKAVSRDGSGYTGFGLQGSTFTGSFEDGMMMMAKGDSAEFIVRADSFFLKSMRYNELPPGIRSDDHLRAIFKIKDVTPKEELEKERKEQMAEREKQMREAEALEMPAIDKYLADNKITVKPMASGVYFIEKKKGTGSSPKVSDTVVVHYTGRLLDGTVFDSSEGREPARFALNIVIPGWIEGLQKMKKGGKAQLIIPSEMAYGARGAGRDIPPYAPLTFEIELLEIVPGGGE